MLTRDLIYIYYLINSYKFKNLICCKKKIYYRGILKIIIKLMISKCMANCNIICGSWNKTKWTVDGAHSTLYNIQYISLQIINDYYIIFR